ncbi:hypothetical protein [Pelomonas sp. BJYL3]|uniref:hypothetical protein n=1 Tax=Pelomonas sp. BJYL3 TaxID=2976697 RepID=UPI0022B50135|nr:hypothetical protein [Pelomonas sp. BJYL3]
MLTFENTNKRDDALEAREASRRFWLPAPFRWDGQHRLRWVHGETLRGADVISPLGNCVAGCTTWYAMNSAHAVHLTWDWVASGTHQLAIEMADPLAVRSNLRLLGEDGPLDRIRAQIVLSRMAVSISWERVVSAVLGL